MASVVSNSVTLWTVACQAPLSMGFCRQEYWSGLPCPPPGDLPNPRIEPMSLMSHALASRFFTTRTTRETTCGPRPILFLLQPQFALGKGRIQHKEIFKGSSIFGIFYFVFFSWLLRPGPWKPTLWAGSYFYWVCCCLASCLGLYVSHWILIASWKRSSLFCLVGEDWKPREMKLVHVLLL